MTDSYPLGCSFTTGFIVVKMFCPRSPNVEIELFRRFEDPTGRRIPMVSMGDGFWEVRLEPAFLGWYYGFRITAIADTEGFEASDFAVLDPYAHFVSVTNDHIQHPKGRLLPDEPYDWEGDTWIAIEDPRDLVIYETHIKDATAHASAGSQYPGTYQGFVEPGIRGGLEHIAALGCNAIELLPLHLYAYKEPPGNDWNPLARNHWGYMSTSFFAPEPRYMLGASTDEPARHSDPSTHRAVKDMVKEIHKKGIAVIVDVVYNHVSNYDRNPLKYIDKAYYFRLTIDGFYRSDSGCGNDFKSENPMSRQLIIDSVLYWAQTFHIDGFRFDLGHLLDKETLIAIREALLKVNPHAVLFAEPWGGGYNPTMFSEIGWSTWNDQIRNGVKGSEPVSQPGYIFGKWHPESTRMSLENYIRGTLLPEANGRYHHPAHSVNYLESHDGYTLGDFIRLTLNPTLASANPSRETLVPLSDHELRIARLAALYLFISQGVPMMHTGQEWSRTKSLDHNSYEKDDITNYLVYSDADVNAGLVSYYRGLIALRAHSDVFRRATSEQIQFHRYDDSQHITATITMPTGSWLVSMNANPTQTQVVHLPPGYWQVLVSGAHAGVEPIATIGGIVQLPPISGMVLRK